MLITNNNIATTPTGQNSNSNSHLGMSFNSAPQQNQQQNLHPAAVFIHLQQNPSTSQGVAMVNNNHQNPAQIHLQLGFPSHHLHQNANNCNDGSNLSSAGSSAGAPAVDPECTPEKVAMGSTVVPVVTSSTTPAFALVGGSPIAGYQNLQITPKQQNLHATPGTSSGLSQAKNSAEPNAHLVTPPSAPTSDQKRKRKRKEPQQQSSGLVYETPPKTTKSEKKINDYFAGKVSHFYFDQRSWIRIILRLFRHST